MHNKTFQIIVLIYLLFSFNIPSTLGVFKIKEKSSSTANLAGWNVSLQPSLNNNISLIPNGSSGSYTLTVESNSDVDTSYTIVVSNIPNGVEVKLDNENNFRTPVSNKVTFSNVGTIAYNANSKSVTHTLTFRAISGATVVNNQSVDVDVIFQQVL